MLEGGDTEEGVGNDQFGSPDGTTMPKTLENEAEASACVIASPFCPQRQAGQSPGSEKLQEDMSLLASRDIRRFMNCTGPGGWRK